MAKARSGQLICRASGWYARITTTVDGKHVRVCKALGTINRFVAEGKLARLLETENPKAEDTKRRETFAEATERVLGKRFDDAALRDRGHRKSELGMLRRHAFDAIGSVAVDSVRPAHIESVLTGCRDSGMSQQSVQHLRQHLSNVFRQLISEAEVSRNPVAGARMPTFPERMPKSRAVLTDAEFGAYLAWEHPQKQFQDAVRERQTMACLSRWLIGLKSGELHALGWRSLGADTGDLGRLRIGSTDHVVIQALRALLAAHWERAGRPTSGLVFPVRRAGKLGNRVGQERQRVSHAGAFRRDLQAAFIAARERGDERVPAKDSARWRELFIETASTAPIDFESHAREHKRIVASAAIEAATSASHLRATERFAMT